MKKRGNVDFYQLIHDVKQSAESGGYLPIIRSKVYESKYEGGVYVTGNIADTYDDVPDSQQWFMYIFSAGRDEFDWLVKGEDLFTAILIEKISDCSKMLLDFLYEYLKMNPRDYFWAEGDWYYTYEDIEKIKQKEFEQYWYCKDPHKDQT